jgi:hypothetical protein
MVIFGGVHSSHGPPLVQELLLHNRNLLFHRFDIVAFEVNRIRIFITAIVQRRELLLLARTHWAIGASHNQSNVRLDSVVVFTKLVYCPLLLTQERLTLLGVLPAVDFHVAVLPLQIQKLLLAWISSSRLHSPFISMLYHKTHKVPLKPLNRFRQKQKTVLRNKMAHF